MPDRLLFPVARFLLLVFSLISGSSVFAQARVSMADEMRGNGKIYVVVAVCLTILIGLFIYVYAVDRRITRLENTGNGNKQ